MMFKVIRNLGKRRQRKKPILGLVGEGKHYLDRKRSLQALERGHG